MAWDGESWSDMGGGFDGRVSSLARHGNQLIAGGSFSRAGGRITPRVARWNGGWHPVGTG